MIGLWPVEVPKSGTRLEDALGILYRPYYNMDINIIISIISSIIICIIISIIIAMIATIFIINISKLKFALETSQKTLKTTK